MANPNVAQLERISQQLIFQVKTIDQLMAQACLEIELAHHLIKSMGHAYDELAEEERINRLFH